MVLGNWPDAKPVTRLRGTRINTPFLSHGENNKGPQSKNNHDKYGNLNHEFKLTGIQFLCNHRLTSWFGSLLTKDGSSKEIGVIIGKEIMFAFIWCFIKRIK